MAELTGKARTKLADSDFAVVRKLDGKKERKYPVYDEAHRRAALQMSHGARSGTPASPDEHRAVHAAVGAKDKALLQNHMRDEHGAGKLKRALDGLVAKISPGLKKRRGPKNQPGVGMTIGDRLFIDGREVTSRGPRPAAAALEHANERARFKRGAPAERVQPAPRTPPSRTGTGPSAPSSAP